jgi:hypothetical protein
MRFVVLLFGLIAVFITAVTGGCFIGFNFVVEALQPTLTDMNYEIPDWAYGSLTGRPHAETGLLLILAAAYGFLGTLISGFLRAGWQGGLLLIFPVLLTTVMNPLAAPAAT